MTNPIGHRELQETIDAEAEAVWVIARAYGVGMQGAAELFATCSDVREAALRLVEKRKPSVFVAVDSQCDAIDSVLTTLRSIDMALAAKGLPVTIRTKQAAGGVKVFITERTS